MSNEFIEMMRRKEIARLHKIQSFSQNWPTWRAKIDQLTQGMSDGTRIWHLGENLSDIFRLTGQGGRTQSTQSAGGAAWESLICWYLNVVFAGTNTVAFKQSKRLVPPVIFDAAAVKYGSHKTNTESDVVIISMPADMKFEDKGKFLDRFDKAVRARLDEISMAIVQCKTNWNDNAQIPMLWDMVYQGNFPVTSSVRLGSHGVTISKLRKFVYSFVVVPTQKKPILPSSIAVHRVGGMTGRNYWGQKSKNGVAQSVSEIFTDNFDEAFPSTVQASVSAAVKSGLINPLWT